MKSSISNQRLLVILSLSFIAISTEGQLLPIVDDDGNSFQSSMPIYIIHLQKPTHRAKLLSSRELKAWHESFLPNTTLDNGKPRILFSYQRVISGFAAMLTEDEVKAMESKDGFILAQREQIYELETTHTPEFLNLNGNEGVWYESSYGDGIVIGVVDSGIPAKHPSFDDENIPSKPKNWKGYCPFTSQITCNNKIIGAGGFLYGDFVSAIEDYGGHGTHVASIAGGNFVEGANVMGMAFGTASGTAPGAHLSIYKVCFRKGCPGSSILAGVEQAISDGVDVINLSLGGKIGAKFHQSEVVIASMGAFMNGILPVVSAGNSGPKDSTLTKDAPWALVVGATSTDRRIRATVKLGDGTELYGESAFQPSSFDNSIMLPIAFPGETGDKEALYCAKGSLAKFDVQDKIVLCYKGKGSDVDKGKEVMKNGGAAMVIMNTPSLGYTTNSPAHWIPASQLSVADSSKIRKYYKKSGQGVATATLIFEKTIFDQRPTPAMAYFSSRGPGLVNGGILKPDVVAPGLNILGAWPEEVDPNKNDTLSTFNFNSGTSMATPHVTGIAALVKKKHPTWPPSFIQSAIITSSRNVDLDGHEIFNEKYKKASIFAVGAGIVNASNALDPGLVYSITTSDYISYVCGLGYTDYEVYSIFHRIGLACFRVPKIKASNLNYPSIMLKMSPKVQSITVHRRVTNVGEATSTYQARITEPEGLSVQLSTDKLEFTEMYQEINFSVTFTVGPAIKSANVSVGQLAWLSDRHVVTSPIAITWS